MQTTILQESNYKEEMQTIVEPYLASIGTEFYLERHAGQKIHCMHYVPENPHAVVMLSHGFVENAEKYKEIAYYFAKEGFSVYLPEHCGHGFSYRMTEDESLVHLDNFERYVEDFIFVTKKAKEDNPGMKIYLYGHSMGGGIAAAVAARAWQRQLQRLPAKWEGKQTMWLVRSRTRSRQNLRIAVLFPMPDLSITKKREQKNPIII